MMTPEQYLIKQRDALRGKIERHKEKSTLKLIARLLEDMDPRSFGSYKLRNTRYALLRARRIAANHTYPRFDSEITDRVDERQRMKAIGKYPLSANKEVWSPVTFRTIYC